jgi:gliding motility-associated-like protein
MKKFLVILFTLATAMGYAQQQILLQTENFETPTNSFDFYTGGVGTNSGYNKWVIDNRYNGAPVYPNTPPQDSILSGTITNAPHSYYLHIYDSITYASSGISDCNWDQNVASDHFCFLNNGFCSLAMTNVTFTFFWIAGGDTNAYGELYYSKNSGPWIKTGQSQYKNQSLWKYETVTDTAFNNVQDLRFGFRWVNAVEANNLNISFGVDDILAVGTYDDVNHAAHIRINQVYPDSVCQNDYLSIQYTLSQPICDGQYQIKLLNSSGAVVNGPNFPIFSINAPDTTGFTALQMPTGVQGSCFHIQLARVSPAPAILGDTSICFTIVACPTVIYTTSAPVMNDADTTCILSEIDVKFYSFGSYSPNNTYYAQLSDSNGSFASPIVLGSLPSGASYQGPPGNISGLIPGIVPPGCGYYIRVVSNFPATVGSLIGPFCVTRCDIETNNIQDLKFCIRYPYGTDTNQLYIQTNHWNNQANYDTCNDFTIQLLDMMTFAVVNTGGLGVYHDSVSHTYNLIVGPYNTLPVAPGAYYMRILSNCSNQPWNQTGTVIRITIGAPQSTPPDILSPDSIYCNTGFVNLTVSPFLHPPSDYQWLSNGLNNGLPFTWEFNPLTINFTNAPADQYTFQVREINYGCPGPPSAIKSINIITTPTGHISGPALTCFGDTAILYVDYQPRTYYTWDTVPGEHIINPGNNIVYLVFDSPGTYTLVNHSLNACGSAGGTFTFKVGTLLDAQISGNSAICRGDTIALTANTSGLSRSFITIDSATVGKPGAMFNLIAHGDLIIDSVACKFLTGPNMTPSVDVYDRAGRYQGNEQDASVWNFLLTSYPTTTATNQMVTLPDYLGITMAAGDTLGMYITTRDNPNINIAYSAPHAPPVVGTVYKSDGVIDFVQGSANGLSATQDPFDAFIGPRVWNGIVYYHTKAGLHYIWNTGDTLPTISSSPLTDSLYWVKIYDKSGCSARDSAGVKINPLPTLSVGPDTLLCDGLSYQVPGVASVSGIVWVPSTALDNPNVINPTFRTKDDTINYVITATDTTGCSASTQLKIAIQDCRSYLHVPDAFSPNGNGTNDHFTIFANRIASYDLKIYNRWGQLVYETNDLNELNDMTKGWDGKYKGQEQNVGTFVYYLHAVDEFTQEINRKGNITLLR